MTMLQAEAANNSSGWRLATESEVHYLFDQLFEGFYSNFSYGGSYGGSSTDGNLGPAYDGHIEDVRNFFSLLGSIPHEANPSYLYMWGSFLDDQPCLGDPCVRTLGAMINESYTLPNGLLYSLIHGPDFYASEAQENTNSYYDLNSDIYRGTYLVRSSVVPIPAAVWLFGSAIGGLGFLRRRVVAP
jgi:hypothetical protein